MNSIMYQEIDIKLNVIFSQPQIRKSSSILDEEIKYALNRNFPDSQEPMKVTEIETAIGNAHVRITTSVDASLSEDRIKQYIVNKVNNRLRMGVVKFEVLYLREEAEIYGNK